MPLATYSSSSSSSGPESIVVFATRLPLLLPPASLAAYLLSLSTRGSMPEYMPLPVCAVAGSSCRDSHTWDGWRWSPDSQRRCWAWIAATTRGSDRSTPGGKLLTPHDGPAAGPAPAGGRPGLEKGELPIDRTSPAMAFDAAGLHGSRRRRSLLCRAPPCTQISLQGFAADSAPDTGVQSPWRPCLRYSAGSSLPSTVSATLVRRPRPYSAAPRASDPPAPGSSCSSRAWLRLHEVQPSQAVATVLAGPCASGAPGSSCGGYNKMQIVANSGRYIPLS